MRRKEGLELSALARSGAFNPAGRANEQASICSAAALLVLLKLQQQLGILAHEVLRGDDLDDEPQPLRHLGFGVLLLLHRPGRQRTAEGRGNGEGIGLYRGKDFLLARC